MQTVSYWMYVPWVYMYLLQNTETTVMTELMTEQFYKKMHGNKLARHECSFWEIPNINENITLQIYV